MKVSKHIDTFLMKQLHLWFSDHRREWARWNDYSYPLYIVDGDNVDDGYMWVYLAKDRLAFRPNNPTDIRKVKELKGHIYMVYREPDNTLLFDRINKLELY